MNEDLIRIIDSLQRIEKRLDGLESEIGNAEQAQSHGPTVLHALEHIDYTVYHIHRMIENDVLNIAPKSAREGEPPVSEFRSPRDSLYNNLLTVNERLSDIRSYLETIETRFGAVEARLAVIEVRLR